VQRRAGHRPELSRRPGRSAVGEVEGGGLVALDHAPEVAQLFVDVVHLWRPSVL
jgi:hypothetical protein